MSAAPGVHGAPGRATPITLPVTQSPLVKVFFHDACFDGTASAAMFAGFYRARTPGARFAPVGVSHKLGDPFEGIPIDGDDNACVDFRYTDHPRMRWWFDHHATAFQPDHLREHYLARVDDRTAFEPGAPSCAGLVARTAATRFGWDAPPHLVELARWADVVDAAAYPSAEAACAVDNPVQRLALWLGERRDPATTSRYVLALIDRSMAEIEREPWIQADLAPALERRARDLEAWARLGDVRGPVVIFDLLAEPRLRAPGFGGYALFPDATYSVTVGATDEAVKVGVGWNPWGKGPRHHDLGALCAQHGGGGHAVVGGVTLPPDAIELGREVARAIVGELTRP
jgi:hypothetical protein